MVSAQPGNEPWAVFVAGHATPYTLSEDAGLPARPFALIGPARGLGAVLRGSAPSHLYVFGAQFDRYLARVILDGTSAEGTVLDCRSGDLWVDDVEIRGGTLGLYAAVCDVRMRRSRIVNAAEWGAKVDVDARLTMDEGGIENNQGGVLTEGSVTLRRTSIIGNYLNGGISARSGTLSLSNSVLWQNVYAIGHIDLGLTASATLNYVVALGESLSCSSASSTYAIKNSIIDNITCTNASVTVDRSLVASTHVALGQGNVGFPLADYDQVFVDHSGGDFHIRPDPPAYLLGIAVRSPTDPAVDFDGDARPSVGAPDYPGIDAP